MSKFRIVKGIESVLNNNNKKLVDIEFLGIGGAFDVNEGMSSALIKTRSGNTFLIDCGYSSYANLKKRGFIDKVNKVFITHTHSDHISGLSTLIYDRALLSNKLTEIECTPEVAVRVKSYLDICGHPEEQYKINTENYLYVDEDSISITKVDTSEYHWPVNNFPNSGLIFHFKTGEYKDDYAVLIYSGDINIPITRLMDPLDYSFVYDKPENVFIFHDMTCFDYDKNPHTNFELLIPVKEVFNNLFTYHHNDKQVALINQKNPDMALTSLVIQGENFAIEELRSI